ncbi:MAG: H-type small acid-soluble spore protein [Deltaproteobacteria bacterium]
MDVRRAKEILHSPDVIRVLYQGAPVWIQNIKGEDTAEITYLGNNTNLTVAINQLEESNPLKWID